MNFKKLIAFCAFLIATSSLYAQGIKYHLLVGTYTSPGKSEGIYTYEFDTQTAEMTLKSKVVVGSPSYFDISKNRKFVYSVGEDRISVINSFAYDANTGVLTLLNSQSSGSRGPTYISVDAKGEYVFERNYRGRILNCSSC